MKKIVLVIPTLLIGGAERVISILANVWANSGHEVHLILLTNAEICYELDQKVILHKLGFINNSRMGKYLSEIRTFLLLRKLLRNLKPDFILSFMIKFNIFVLLANCCLKNRIFVSDRSNPYINEKFLFTLLQKWSYKLSDGIIVQTEEAKQHLSKLYKNQNIISIPNPLKKIKIDNTIKKENIILNIGRAVESKGQKYLMESFSMLNSDGWELVFLGDGPLKDELIHDAKIFGIQDKVKFVGEVNYIDQWLNMASIFAFPSIHEGFPNALAEAMAAGLPCISFDCPTGPSELITNNRNGILIPLKDIEQFSNKLFMLMNNPELRQKLSNEAKKISTKFDSINIAQKYFEFCTDSGL